MRRFAVVSTCHAAGYEAYGHEMVDTFLEHWPADAPLMLYHEGFEPPKAAGRIEPHDLVVACPDLASFKARHLSNPRAHGGWRPWARLRVGSLYLTLPVRTRKGRFRWDAVRFAHKTYAIFDAARRTDADALIWIDADTRFFAKVTAEELEALAPTHSAVSCLQRSNYSECGFVVYNLRHPETARLLAEFEAMYTQDLLFAEREFHDSYLFDVVCRRARARGANIHDIAEGIGWRTSHVLINSRLGAFMDHMKGDRKGQGTSRADDLIVPRTEDYWQRVR